MAEHKQTRAEIEREMFGIAEKRKLWPDKFVRAGRDVMDYLSPDSDEHSRVLEYLLKRLENSEDAMSDFHTRWKANEIKIQAYIDLSDHEKILKAANEKGEPPRVTSVVIPYTYAIVSSITTFLMHTFFGRRPFLPVTTYDDDLVNNAMAMESKLQYDSDHTRFPRAGHNVLQDSQVYGVGVSRSFWSEQRAIRTRSFPSQELDEFGTPAEGKMERRDELVTVYEGNMAFSQDPYNFFPDPTVPMAEVARRGEYVFWRTFEGRHVLLKDDNYTHVSAVSPNTLPGTAGNRQASNRAIGSGGSPEPGSRESRHNRVGSTVQVDEGTANIIPRELGLGRSKKVEMWLFTILNKKQIVQARPFDANHGLHPVAVTEPYTLGYGFGNMGIVDYMSPLQDLIGWLVNSHMDNVRRVINDTLIVDPNAIEMQDLKKAGRAGRVIRMKKSSGIRDVRTAIQQLAVIDVTQQHMRDMESIIRIGQMLSAVTDNVLGLQDASSRKTATEVRTSGQGAASRLANQSKIISSQHFTDLFHIWNLNNQQEISDSFSATVLGRDGEKLRITPELLVGDFHFQGHDGTLPVDKVAMLDIWKEIFQVALGDQEIRSNFNVPKMFEFIAELGGVQNITAFKMSLQADGVVEEEARKGNLVPVKAGSLTNESPAQTAEASGGVG